jgi:ATP-dependent Clp protease, protease subunit
MKSEFENYIANGIDEANRRIFFGQYLHTTDSSECTDFTSISVEFAVRAIHKFAIDAPKKPIEIHMNSFGGELASMQYLYDTILACPCQLKFFGGGMVASAATWIMAACDERYLHKNTQVMLHKMAFWEDGKITDIEIRVAEESRYQDLLEQFFAENSKMPKSFWHEATKRDLYLTSEEAILLGIADAIIEPKRRGNLRKMRQAALKNNAAPEKLKKLVNSVFSRVQAPIKVSEIILNQNKEESIDESLGIEDNTQVTQETTNKEIVNGTPKQ